MGKRLKEIKKLIKFKRFKKRRVDMRVYDSMKKREVDLKFGKVVKIYVCGITAYDYSHVGHARNIVFFDTLRRFLEFKGHEVIYVQNFTDVDDKIIKKAIDLGKTSKEVSDYFIQEYWRDINEMNVKKGIHPRVTEYIPKIISAVERLIKKGYAYIVENKNGYDVYFHVPSFERYGELSGYTLEELNQHRIEPDERKKDPKDFALWKSAKDEDFKAKSYFNSPWGLGRPGWHIECSVMSSDILGVPFDIHGGGRDLIFPHHENERAQTFALFDKEPVRLWIHNNFVMVNGEKMSKSLGNIVKIRDVIKKYGGEVLRYFLLTSHYRSPINYSFEAIERAKKGYEHLYYTLRNLDMEIAYLKTEKVMKEMGDKYDKYKEDEDSRIKIINISQRESEVNNKDCNIKSRLQEFISAFENDINTAKAIAVMHEFSAEINKKLFTANLTSLEKAFKEFKTMASILGIFEKYSRIPILSKEDYWLIKEREIARKERDFERADKIREKFKEKGIHLVDTKKGTRWFISS